MTQQAEAPSQRIAATALRDMAHAMVMATGAGEARATAVADHLVQANLFGHDSHGVGMLPKYMNGFQTGQLHPTCDLKTVSETGAILVADGGLGYGQWVGTQAMARGIELAHRHGVAAVALRRSYHLGRIGAYAEQCAAAGLASIHFVNVNRIAPLVAPWGGSDARIGTNPFTAALPVEGAPPIVLDMATSRTALGKVRVAYNKGTPYMTGALIDGDGHPTTNPAVMFEEPLGAILPFGEHKGYGLAVICELFSAALSGGETYNIERRHPAAIENNMLSVILKPEALGPKDHYLAEVERFRNWVTASPASATAIADRVLLPGEPERRVAAERAVAGIPVDVKTLADLRAAATAVGAAWPRGLP